MINIKLGDICIDPKGHKVEVITIYHLQREALVRYQEGSGISNYIIPLSMLKRQSTGPTAKEKKELTKEEETKNYKFTAPSIKLIDLALVSAEVTPTSPIAVLRVDANNGTPHEVHIFIHRTLAVKSITVGIPFPSALKRLTRTGTYYTILPKATPLKEWKEWAKKVRQASCKELIGSRQVKCTVELFKF